MSLPVLGYVVGEETPWKGRSLKGFQQTQKSLAQTGLDRVFGLWRNQLQTRAVHSTQVRRFEWQAGSSEPVRYSERFITVKRASDQSSCSPEDSSELDGRQDEREQVLVSRDVLSKRLKGFINFSLSDTQGEGQSVSILSAPCQEVLRSLAVRYLMDDGAGEPQGKLPVLVPHDSSESLV